MKNKNSVFIAKSLDGYIADKKGGLDWLHAIPNPNNLDMRYNDFIGKADAIVMGRKTFETVCNFDIDWPYKKPVFVVSSTIDSLSEEYQGKVELIKGKPKDILKYINDKGYLKLYIDGGRLIQAFLKEDLIDEMIITTIPVLLGGGIPLFGELNKQMKFQHIESRLFLKEIVQDCYIRKR